MHSLIVDIIVTQTGSVSPCYRFGKSRCSRKVFAVGPAFVKALELALAVEFALLHGNTDLVGFRLDFFPGRIEHGGRSEVHDASHLILGQRPYERPHFRIYAECIV